jgi:hypothetical protein
MATVAASFRFALGLGLLLAVAAPAGHAAELACADQEVTARGNGFSPSPELSADKAKAEWLKKATEIYSDATMETAKDPKLNCVSQGLYSNCTVSAVPCGATPAPPKPN